MVSVCLFNLRSPLADLSALSIKKVSARKILQTYMQGNPADLIKSHINVSICLTSLIHNFAKSFFGQYFIDTALSCASPPLSRMLDLVTIVGPEISMKKIWNLFAAIQPVYIYIYIYFSSRNFNNIILMEPVL